MYLDDPLAALKRYIRFPSVSTDKNYAEGLDGARNYATELLEELGFEVTEVATNLHPILYAERFGDPAWPHIVIYGHYDVQPSDPDDLWTTPPFSPVERGGRLYGRGSADNKGPTIVHMAALHRLLKRRPDLPLNITYVIEGEEEIGSPSMPAFFEEYAEKLSGADCLVVSDTGSPGDGQIVITTALRGLVGLEVFVEGANTDLHSGIHGGAVMNPIRALNEICASLHTADGAVNVPGFYEGVETVQTWERDELAKYPQSEDEYRTFLGLEAFAPPPGFNALEAVRFAPTLEFNGISGGYQGEGTKTVIPRKASVKITCRLVSNQDPAAVLQRVKQTISERCPLGVKVSFVDGGVAPAYLVVPPGRPNTPAGQTDTLCRVFAASDQAIATNFGRAPLYLREGGSIPVIADFKLKANLDSVMIGLFTPKDRLHAPDESFDLDIMQRAILAFEEIFERAAKA